jgi:hypothetical protein
MPSSRIASASEGEGKINSTIIDRTKNVILVNGTSSLKLSNTCADPYSIWGTNISMSPLMSGGSNRSRSSCFTDTQERHRLRKHKSRLAAQIRRTREAETLSSLEKMLPLQCLPACLEISEILRLTFVSVKLLSHLREFNITPQRTNSFEFVPHEEPNGENYHHQKCFIYE